MSWSWLPPTVFVRYDFIGLNGADLVMGTCTRIGAWAYGVQAFLVLPWFLGAIYRREQSLWVWQEYASALRRHGGGDALFAVYLYVIFYSAFIVIPYALLGIRFSADVPGLKHSVRIGRLVLSVWFSATFFLFANSLFEFIRSLPSEHWNGWLLILWGAATVFVVHTWRTLENVRSRQITSGTATKG